MGGWVDGWMGDSRATENERTKTKRDNQVIVEQQHLQVQRQERSQTPFKLFVLSYNRLTV